MTFSQRISSFASNIQPSRQRRRLAWRPTAMRWVLVPTAVYLLGFALLAYPTITSFGSEMWTASPDGWQSLWTLWWFDKAVNELRQLPWHTMLIHHPYGISLWAHTMIPFNGMIALGLLRFWSLPTVYNFLILFSFVTAGVTAFWLAYYLSRRFIPSLIAGYLFTFSSYHWAHARAHLNLVSLEWIPLFVLCWYRWLEKPTVWRMAAAVAALTLVTLCDYYYFFYSVLTALLMALWWTLAERGRMREHVRAYAIGYCVFAAAALLLIAPLLLVVQNEGVEGHSPFEYSLDLATLLIPGRNWRWAFLTRDLARDWTGNIAENSVALGFGFTALLVWVFLKRAQLGRRDLSLWYFIFFAFAILSLGPILQINGRAFDMVSLPYAWLVSAVPVLQASGVPMRMIVMSTLAAALLGAFGFRLLLESGRRGWVFAGLLFALIIFETLPKPLPAQPPTVPPYVTVLAALPDKGGVMDLVGFDQASQARGIPPGKLMFYQTVHGKPVAFGYTSRIPALTAQRDARLWSFVRAGRWDILCEVYNFGYLVRSGDNTPDPEFSANARVIYQDSMARVYELNPSSECGTASARLGE